MKKIFILISIIFILGGCYDYKELNDMNIVSGIGVDYKDGKYIVNLEITKSSKDDSSTAIDTYLVSGENQNIAQAFLEAKNRSDKLVYMKHVEILILSEDLCKKGITDVIDYIIRDTTINDNYFAVVTDNPKELFSNKIENKNMAELIKNTLDYYLDGTSLDDLDILFSNIINLRKDIALPYVIMEEDNIILDDFVYFDEDKEIDKINSKIYSFLSLDSININFSNNANTINIYKKDISYDVKDKKVNINIKAYATIKEINDNIDLTNVNNYTKLEDNFKKVIILECNDFLEQTLNDGVDLLGINDTYYKKYRIDTDNIDYTINLDLIINRNGTIYGVLNDN